VFNGAPQFEQKAMFAGTAVPHLEQELVDDTDILFSSFSESRLGSLAPSLFPVYTELRLKNYHGYIISISSEKQSP
jgi:hypothetical protein